MLARIAPLLLLATPVMAQAPDGNAEVRAAADAFVHAQEQGDGTALDRLLARDFLFVRSSGRVGDRRDYIDGFTAPGMKLEPLVVTDRLFQRLSADVVIVGGEARLRGTENGRPLAQHYRYSDTLVRRDGRWQVAYSQITPLPLP
ncbi:nuclear transport factor 2 family protein [uncultured Sphingomonas sp.]|uniref:nuclear transport factor 2 family protein n=1 Tax=uncultured Sphingomonas sp. TaxID=158754 RepID=UPI0025F78AAB|nr:nuclear transport factor 2 family protein [uncultured Sphingomonas sp.]